MTQILVSNLPISLTQEELEKYFTKFGAVSNVRIVYKTDQEKQFSRGFGFVDFPQPGLFDTIYSSLIKIDDHIIHVSQIDPQINNNIYFSNVDPNLTVNEVIEHFSKYNPIKCKIICSNNDHCKGFGYIEVGSTEDCYAAIQDLNNSKLKGVIISVCKSKYPYDESNSDIPDKTEDISIYKESMKEKIWRHFIQILTYRNDLIDVIKPFFQNLQNNSTHENFKFEDIYFLKNYIHTYQTDALINNQTDQQINKQRNQSKYIFLYSLSKYQRQLLLNYQILNQETYETLDLVFFSSNIENNIERSYHDDKWDKEIETIFHEDNLEKLRKLILDNRINASSSL